MRHLLVTAILLLSSVPLQAQHLRDKLSDLFIFGSGQSPLDAGWNQRSIQSRVHSHPWKPLRSRRGGQQWDGHLVSDEFDRQQCGQRARERHQRRLDVQLSGRGADSDVHFRGTDLRRTGTDARPRTYLASLTRTGVHFKTLRGVDLNHVNFIFTHANSDFPGCDSISGGDCSLLGVPALENETIDLNLALDVRLNVTGLVLAYGVTDRIDVGVALPLVSVSLAGRVTHRSPRSGHRPRFTSLAVRLTTRFSRPRGPSMDPPPDWAMWTGG